MKNKHIWGYILVLSMTIHVQAQEAGQPRPMRVPAYPGVILKVQPSGDTLHTYLRGDEWHHYAMTTDGWEIKENDKGELCYAVRQKDGTTVAGKRIARDADKRTCCDKCYLRRKGIQRINH